MTMADISEKTFARLINIAGRQRMLSQRIGFLLLDLNAKTANGQDCPASLWTMLETALSDFSHGYAILMRGDEAQALPALQSTRIDAVLQQRLTSDDTSDSGSGYTTRNITGHDVIERFLARTSEIIDTLKRGSACDDAELGSYSTFVLGPVLQTLQSIVIALEEDFDDEMQLRGEQRQSDTEKVMSALGEIQKASKFSRMIALNAKISANRAGPLGQEFGALTEEIKKISNDITNSSQDILHHLNRA